VLNLSHPFIININVCLTVYAFCNEKTNLELRRKKIFSHHIKLPPTVAPWFIIIRVYSLLLATIKGSASGHLLPDECVRTCVSEANFCGLLYEWTMRIGIYEMWRNFFSPQLQQSTWLQLIFHSANRPAAWPARSSSVQTIMSTG